MTSISQIKNKAINRLRRVSIDYFPDDLLPASPVQSIPSVQKCHLKEVGILVACFPKSGSTYFSKLLSTTFHYKNANIVRYYGHNEQNIDELRLRQALKSGSFVAQNHTKGTENNIFLIKKYNIKTIVLVRNIFDVILSCYDHVLSEDHKAPMVYIHKEFFLLSSNEQLTFLIKNVLPWYLSFFSSWVEATDQGDLPVLWMSYEKIFSNQPQSLQEVVDFYSLPNFKKDTIEESIESMKKENTRLNKGVSGRGKTLSSLHQSMILELIDSWHFNNDLYRKHLKLIGLDL